MNFPGFTPTTPENASLFSGAQWDPNADECFSKVMSIIGDVNGMTNPGGASYNVYGGNKSVNIADMVPIADDAGLSGNRPLTTPFEKKFWPYKYIGVQYNTSGGTGTVNILFHSSATKVKVI